jgi:chromate transport protein ChrA
VIVKLIDPKIDVGEKINVRGIDSQAPLLCFLSCVLSTLLMLAGFYLAVHAISHNGYVADVAEGITSVIIGLVGLFLFSAVDDQS